MVLVGVVATLTDWLTWIWSRGLFNPIQVPKIILPDPHIPYDRKWHGIGRWDANNVRWQLGYCCNRESGWLHPSNTGDTKGGKLSLAIWNVFELRTNRFDTIAFVRYIHFHIARHRRNSRSSLFVSSKLMRRCCHVLNSKRAANEIT